MVELLITLMDNRQFISNEIWFGCESVIININNDKRDTKTLNISDLKSIIIIGD